MARAIRVIRGGRVGRWIYFVEDLSDTQGEITNQSGVRCDFDPRGTIDVPEGKRLVTKGVGLGVREGCLYNVKVAVGFRGSCCRNAAVAPGV